MQTEKLEIFFSKKLVVTEGFKSEGNSGHVPLYLPDKPVLTKLMQQSRFDEIGLVLMQPWCNFCGSVGGEDEQLVPLED